MDINIAALIIFTLLAIIGLGMMMLVTYDAYIDYKLDRERRRAFDDWQSARGRIES